jgi:uncharacterized membrane protein HdeD (DUF308 family)
MAHEERLRGKEQGCPECRFVERDVNPLWWLGLIAGVLMVILAFWTSGQFFIEKAYTLLVFAGIWALMQGVTDIVRAFAIRGLHDRL